MFLSIVIPVYNTSRYVKDCIDSCLDQDISSDDYEIIIINDGSTDGSGEIIESYAKLYSNIKYIEKSNSGVSDTRNMGIKTASGDYIWFVDSDDIIKHNVLSKLKEKLASGDIDKLRIGSYRFYAGEPYDQLAKIYLSNIDIKSIYICMSIFKKSYLYEHDLHFSKEIKHGEDALFAFEFDRFANKKSEFGEICYFYRYHNESASHNISTESIQSQIRSRAGKAKIIRKYFDEENGSQNKTSLEMIGDMRTVLVCLAKLSKETDVSEVKNINYKHYLPYRHIGQLDEKNIKSVLMLFYTNIVCFRYRHIFNSIKRGCILPLDLFIKKYNIKNGKKIKAFRKKAKKKIKKFFGGIG